MAVSFISLAAPLASTANQSTAYTASAGTAAAQDLLIAFVSASGNTTAGTMSGGGLTWTLLTSQTKNAGADICAVFWAFNSTDVLVTPAYIPFAAATGCIISVIRVGGSTASSVGPNLQQTTATATASTANPTITFGTATLISNGLLLLIANGTNSETQFTAPTGFSEVIEVSFNSPTNAAQVSTIVSGSSATTYTWTNANTTPWRSFGLEFVSAVATSFDPFGTLGFFGL